MRGLATKALIEDCVWPTLVGAASLAIETYPRSARGPDATKRGHPGVLGRGRVRRRGADERFPVMRRELA
jgi:hypothetical protein